VQDAGALVLDGLDRAFGAVVFRAEEHRETVLYGRTHGVHAEPTTFGLKLAGWGVRRSTATGIGSAWHSRA
jgi:adenylosuccinate lyase